MEDEAILALYLRRDEEVIRQTELKYGRLCQAIAGRILASPQDSEECLNDTWLGLWNAIPPSRPGNFAVYAGRVARNLALKRCEYLSAAKRSAAAVCFLEEMDECVSDRESIESELENRRAAMALDAFLRRQPVDKRVVFLRRYWYFDSIGDVGDDLVEQAEYVPNYAKQKRGLRLRAAAGVAAAIVLMVTSFTTGALAFSRETVVEVPAEQEIISVEEAGISLILPESWKGRYVSETSGDGREVYVYVKSIYDWCVSRGKVDPDTGAPFMGALFSLLLWFDEPMTPEEFYERSPIPAVFLLSTEDGVYCLGRPSDVQYPMVSALDDPDMTDPDIAAMAAMEEEYFKMNSEIKDIQVVLNGAMAKALNQTGYAH